MGTSESKTVMILGGGVGGLVTANLLRKALPKEHRVLLVERDAAFVFAPSFLWLMTGDRTAEKISRPLARLSKKGIEVIRGEVQHVNVERREATVYGRTHACDYMVIALGADLAPDTIPGLAEAGHTFYTLAGAEGLRDALGAFEGGKLVVLTAAPMYKCPAAPYEAAMLLEDFLHRRGLREKTQIDLYAAEPGPMGVTGPEVSKAIRQMVEAKGITYHPQHQVKEVNPATRTLSFANGAQATFDLLAYVPPHRAPKVLRDAGLCGDSGWLSADRNTMETKFPAVYALGDVISIPLKMGKPLPRAGVFAHHEAEVVAQNIARAITGKGKPAAFEGEGECFIEMGQGKAGFGKGNFYGDPLPQVKLNKPGRHWHAAKVLFEKDWLRRWL